MVQFAMKPQKVEISYKTIIFTALLGIGLYIAWIFRDIFLLLFVCLLLTEALNPTISKLEKLKIPRTLAIIIVYLVILAIISVSIAGIIPIFVEQTPGLIQALPNALQNFKIFGTPAIDFSSQFKLLESLPSEIAKTAVSLFSNLLTGLLTLVITFYLLHERKNIDRYSLNFFGNLGREKVLKIINLLENRLGSWVTGELLLMTIIGLLSYVAYFILGLNYAVPLAIVAGLMEIVPNIGPIITTIIAGLVGLTISPLTALLTVLAGLIIHQSENNFITPKIMKEAVGLNPLITILAIAMGAKLAGIIGAVLAIPVFLTIQIIVSVLMEKK
jgi:predicted PurR-regulated permease PerM